MPAWGFISNMLEVKNLSYSYSTAQILKDVSFSIEKGESVALLGASGSGKTTLLKILSGLLNATSGSVLVDTNTKEPFSLMRQEDLLLPWRTVLQNVLLPTELGSFRKKEKRSVYRKKAIDLLFDVDLLEDRDKYPHQLSTGMKKRVQLAKSLMLDRPILLFDEPFASLDFSLREQMYSLLKSMQKKYQFGFLFVTHDFLDAKGLADRAYFLKDKTLSTFNDIERLNENIVRELL